MDNININYHDDLWCVNERRISMKKISEIIMCIILLTWIVVMVVNNNRINGHKKCCVKTAQEVYEYEGWIVK